MKLTRFCNKKFERGQAQEIGKKFCLGESKCYRVLILLPIGGEKVVKSWSIVKWNRQNSDITFYTEMS